MVNAGEAQIAAFAIPPSAVAQWRALSAAIDEHGAPVCASADPEAWWEPARFGDALAGCRPCPVAAECLSYAEAAGERYGVWGGRSPAERGRRTSPRPAVAS